MVKIISTKLSVVISVISGNVQGRKDVDPAKTNRKKSMFPNRKKRPCPNLSLTFSEILLFQNLNVKKNSKHCYICHANFFFAFPLAVISSSLVYCSDAFTPNPFMQVFAPLRTPLVICFYFIR